MNNELATTKSWWEKNWKWFLPSSSFILVCAFFIISKTTGLTDLAQAYADASLCQNAINKANENEEVIDRLGKLDTIDNLAIMEGNSVYSNGNKNVEISVRVTGKNGNGKMDISAEKNGEKWKYKNIKIRIKKTGEEIQILESN